MLGVTELTITLLWMLVYRYRSRRIRMKRTFRSFSDLLCDRGGDETLTLNFLEAVVNILSTKTHS